MQAYVCASSFNGFLEDFYLLHGDNETIFDDAWLKSEQHVVLEWLSLSPSDDRDFVVKERESCGKPRAHLTHEKVRVP